MSLPRIRHPRQLLAVLLALLFLACATGPERPAAAPSGTPAHSNVVLAVAAGIQDTGLLDALLPSFEQMTGYHVKPVAVNSEQALEMGEQGKADVLLVHSPEAEQPFIATGAGRNPR